MLGMFYADCCQTFMNWFPEMGVSCSPSDGSLGNACAMAYTSLDRFLPFVLNIALNNANTNSEEERK